MTACRAAARKCCHSNQKHTQHQLPNSCFHGKDHISASGGKDQPHSTLVWGQLMLQDALSQCRDAPVSGEEHMTVECDYLECQT